MGPMGHAGTCALSVVVPVFNGEAFIEATLRGLFEYLGRQSYAAELIVVDDGSTDDTAARVESAIAGAPIHTLLLRRERNEGKGAAIAAGMAHARGAHRIFLDADLAYPPESLAAIHASLEESDIAIASRADPRSRLLLNPAFFLYAFLRHAVGRAFNFVVRLFLLHGIRDSQAGLKGFRAAAAERLFNGWLPRGFSFDLALLYRARRLGFSIAQVPVSYCSLDEPTTVRFLRDTSRMLRDVAVIRVRLVGETFERGGALLARRIDRGIAQLREQLTDSSAQPLLLLALGLCFILMVIGRVGLRSFAVPPLGWLGAIGSFLFLAWSADFERPPRRLRLFRTPMERNCFLLLLATTAAVRLLYLGSVPAMEHGDSAECGLQGLAILQGNAPDVFSFSPWYGTPFLSYVPYALSFWLFDVSMWSLRLPSAIFGTAAVVPLYFLTRRWFGIRAALFAGTLYALSHAAVHFSRIGLWNIQVLFYELASFALLIAGVRRRSAVPSALAGVVAGLALYSYTAGRLIPLIVLIYLAAEAWRDPRRAARAAGFFAAGLLICSGPLLMNYIEQPSVLLADRTASVWVLSDANRHHVAATLGTNAPLAVMWEQVKRTMLGFFALGDTSSQYGTPQPLLSPPLALIAFAGVVYALWHARQARFQFLLLWLGLALVLGSILVIDPPSYTRLIVAFPLPYVFAAALLADLAHRARRRWNFAGGFVAVAFVLVAAQSAAFNLAGYRTFTHDMSLMTREWDVLRVLHRLGSAYDYYLYTGPFMLADAPVFRLFATGTRAVSAFTETDLPERLPRDSAFVVLPEFRSVGLLISERFPGVEREVVSTEGVRQVIVYRCSEENGCRRGRS